MFWLRTYSGAAIVRGLLIPVGFVVWAMVLLNAAAVSTATPVAGSATPDEVCLAD